MCWRMLIGIQFFGLVSWASTYKVLDSHVIQPSLLRHNSLTKVFQSSGLSSLRDQSFVFAGRAFDFAFVSSDWGKWILLKEGLKAPESERGRIISSKELSIQVVNFEHEGGFYILLASGFTASELKGVLKSITNLAEQASFVPWMMIASQAFARDCNSTDDPKKPFQMTLKHIESTELLKKIGKCGADALQGAGQSATNTLEFFKNLALNPVQLWKEMKDSFIDLKNFVFNLHDELEKVLSQLQGLSLEQRLTLACTLTGDLMLGVASAATLGGAQLAKALPQLLLKLRNSTTAIAKLSELKRRGFNIPDLNESSRKVLSCVR